jgi:hypothetical protein
MAGLCTKLGKSRAALFAELAVMKEVVGTSHLRCDGLRKENHTAVALII